MKIIIGSDHAGYKLKENLKKALADNDISDIGTDSEERCDYPAYAAKAAKAVAKDKASLGILVCGSGIGMSIAANKVKGIRAALAYNENTAKLAKQHNNANILCLGSREISEKDAVKIAKLFIKTPFSDEDRHLKRVVQIMGLEK